MVVGVVVEGGLQGGVEVHEPLAEVVEIAEVKRDLQMHGAVEHVQQLVKQHAGLFGVVAQDAFHQNLQLREDIGDELFEGSPLHEGQVLVVAGHLGHEVCGGHDGAIQVFLQQFVEGACAVFEVGRHHSVHDFLVEIDGLGHLIDLVEQVEEVVGEEGFLVLGDGRLERVLVALLDEVLERGDDHDEDLWGLVGHQLQQFLDEGGFAGVLHQPPLGGVDGAGVEATLDERQQLTVRIHFGTYY